MEQGKTIYRSLSIKLYYFCKRAMNPIFLGPFLMRDKPIQSEYWSGKLSDQAKNSKKIREIWRKKKQLFFLLSFPKPKNIDFFLF